MLATNKDSRRGKPKRGRTKQRRKQKAGQQCRALCSHATLNSGAPELPLGATCNKARDVFSYSTDFGCCHNLRALSSDQKQTLSLISATLPRWTQLARRAAAMHSNLRLRVDPTPSRNQLAKPALAVARFEHRMFRLRPSYLTRGVSAVRLSPRSPADSLQQTSAWTNAPGRNSWTAESALGTSWNIADK